MTTTTRRAGQFLVVITDEDELYARCCAEAMNNGRLVHISRVYTRLTETEYHYKKHVEIVVELPDKDQ